jgi:hypothetical protein
MTVITYTGNTAPTFDTWTFVLAALGSPPTSNFFTVICNTKSITYTCLSGDTAPTAAAALQALLSASTIPEFAEYNWTVNSATITATAKASGIPGVFTVAVGNGGGSGSPAFTMTHTVAATGPNDVSNAANYSTGSLPVNGDTLILNAESQSLLYNLGSQSGVTLAKRIVNPDFGGTFGLPITNASGGYPEYRATYWAAPATLDYISSNSSLMQIDSGSIQTSLYVSAGTLNWRGSNTSNVANVTGGTLNINPNPGDTGKFATINLSNGTVTGSLTTTVATINQTGGSLSLPNGWTGAASILGGLAILGGGGLTVTSLTVGNGTCVLNMGGASSIITNVTLNPGGTIDKSQNISPITFTNVTGNGGQITDPAGAITPTNGYLKGATVRTLSFN